MATTRVLTVRELEESPPEGEWELIDGELIAVSPSSYKSATTSHRIGRLVGNYVDEHRLGDVTSAEGGFVLFADRETLLAPDVAFVRQDRIPPEEEQNRFARLAPDLAVEVLSPSDQLGNAMTKVGLYLQAGVRMVWLVDPAKRSILVFGGDDTTLTLGEDDTLDGGEILPGFVMRVADLLGT